LLSANTYSILETVDVFTAERTIIHEFDYVIEAPNWTRDGRYLVYNAAGRMVRYELATHTIEAINTDFAIDCNNDHVLSPTTHILPLVISLMRMPPRASTLCRLRGVPTLVTERAPSYLHGWSPDGAAVSLLC
jgi:Tol biopolymer transport system component